MNMIDKLFGPRLTEDMTESTWWTDTVFRELEQGFADEPGGALAAASVDPATVLK